MRRASTDAWNRKPRKIRVLTPFQTRASAPSVVWLSFQAPTRLVRSRNAAVMIWGRMWAKGEVARRLDPVACQAWSRTVRALHSALT